MIAANLPLASQQVNHANVMGAMLAPQTQSSTWTSEAQIQDLLPQIRTTPLVVMQPLTGSPHTIPSATTM